MNKGFSPPVMHSGVKKMKKEDEEKNQVHSGSSQALEGEQHMSEQHFVVMKT